MIALGLARVMGFLRAVPWQAWLVLAVLLTAWLWGNHRYSQGYAASEAKHAAIATRAIARARKADAAAQATVDAGNTITAAQNDAARKAAAESDDPLRAALDSLGERK